MADGVWKGVYPQVLGRSRQLSLNKFFDRSTPSMRKVDDGKKKRKKKKKRKECCFQWPLTSLPVGRPNADRLERCVLVPISPQLKNFSRTTLVCAISVFCFNESFPNIGQCFIDKYWDLLTSFSHIIQDRVAVSVSTGWEYQLSCVILN